MRFRDALTYAMKYHALAVLPTLLGGAIAVAGVWIGVGQHLTSGLNGGLATLTSPERLLGALNLPVAVAGIVIGFYVRRVGRTALLVRTQARAIRDVEPATAASEGDAVEASATRSSDDSAGDDPNGWQSGENAAAEDGSVFGDDQQPSDASDAGTATDGEADSDAGTDGEAGSDAGTDGEAGSDAGTATTGEQSDESSYDALGYRDEEQR